MNNLFVSLLYLIISFSATLVIYKRFGKFGLYSWMCLLVVICNIQTIKLSEIFGLTISLGNISYGALFLTTDIISEKYGRSSATEATNLSFVFMILFTILMYLFLQYTPCNSDFSQNAFETIFSFIPRITLGSLTAYCFSQRCDAYLYEKLKKKYNKVWISNNVSTIISQVLDTTIFVLIAFVGTMKLNEINEEQKTLKSNNKIVKFDYEHYIDACKVMAEEIKKNYNLDEDNIELIGMARGGLPMLVTLSHLLGVRKVSMIQTQMSNSDNCHDYGKFRYMSDNIDNSKKKCILFEDIIYKGTTTNGVIDILKQRGKEVLGVYSLIIDNGFKEIEIPNNDVDIKYAYEITEDDWVYFFWETDLREIK